MAASTDAAAAAEHDGSAVQAATSRLCVKNLPKYVNEPRLKEYFSTRGEVTDVKILRTRCGLLGGGEDNPAACMRTVCTQRAHRCGHDACI